MKDKNKYNKVLTPDDIILDSKEDIIERLVRKDNETEITIRTTRASGSFSTNANESTHIKLLCEWSSTGNSSANTSNVSATLSVYSNMAGTCRAGSHLTINGNKKDYNGFVVVKDGKKVIKNILCNHTVSNISHNADGSKSITITYGWGWHGYVWHNSYSGNISTVSGSGTANLDQLAKHPSTPTLHKPSNTNITVQSNGEWVVYAGGTISLSTSGGEHAHQRKLHLECYYPGSGWADWKPHSNFNTWVTTTGTLSASFAGTGGNRGFQYRITAYIKSSTGHSTHATTYYFVVNDFPSISGFRTNVSQTQGDFTLAHNGISDSWNAGTRTKYYWRKNGGSWGTIINDGGNSRTLSISNYCSVGETAEFAVQPYDGLEWGDMVAGVHVKRQQVYSKPSLEMEGATNNATITHQGTPAYQGDQSIFFAVANAGSYHQSLIKIGYYDHRENNVWRDWNPPGFNVWGNSVNPSHLFSTANNDRGFKWGVRGEVKSPSGDITASDWRYFWINDIPVMNDFRSNVTRTRDNVTLTWDTASDNIHNAIAYDIANFKNGTHYLLGNTESKSITINLVTAGASKGDTVNIKMRALDTFETGAWNDKVIPIVINSNPYFDNGSVIRAEEEGSSFNNVFVRYINLTFPTIKDVDTTNGSSYSLYYSKKTEGGAYSSWALFYEGITSKTYKADCNSILGAGDSIKFRVQAKDDLGDVGIFAYSEEFMKNKKPATPSVGLTGVRIDGRIAKIDSVSWHIVVGTNQINCKHYDCEIQIVNSAGVVLNTIHHRTTETSWIPDINLIERGAYFHIRVRTTDTFDASSDYHVSEKLKRNQLPGYARDIKVVEKAETGEDLTQVITTWLRALDPDDGGASDSLVTLYHVKITNKRTGREVVAQDADSGQLITVFGEQGDILQVGVIAYDDLGETLGYSDDIELELNTAPEKPLATVLKGKTVHNERPRLPIQINADKNNDELIMYISVNGEEYNSDLNPAFFNKASYVQNEKAIIRLPNLIEGANNISVKMYDKFHFSESEDFTITYQPVSFTFEEKENQFIRTIDFNKLKEAVNVTREAYGKHRINFPTISEDTTIIASSYFSDTYRYAREVTEWINTSYPGFNVSSTTPVFINQIIKKNMVMEIVKLIRHT